MPLVLSAPPRKIRTPRVTATLTTTLRLSRGSGVAIENLSGDDIEKLAAPVKVPQAESRKRKPFSSEVVSSQVDHGPLPGAEVVQSSVRISSADILTLKRRPWPAVERHAI